MPIALARRYRPRRFADLVGQDHVAEALRGAVARDRVGHGYLLTGPRGVGKTTAARILAMAMNCENRAPDGEPCGECESCRRIWNGAAGFDVVEMDAASNRGVDDARDLRERAMYAASQAGHHKVYIVDEAHMLTREAWNVLLKILEEPPPGVVFVFATTEPQKIANTAAPVLSRLQRFDFRRIGPAAILARLEQVLAAEKLAAERDALLLIARHADGGMRDALSVLDQCLSFGEGPLSVARVRSALGLLDDEAYGELLGAVAARNPGAVFAVMQRVVDSGADLAEFASDLSELLRAVLMSHYQVEPEALTESARAMVANLAAQLRPEDVLRMLKMLGDAEPAIRRNASPRVALETLLLRWSVMDRAVDIRAVLAGGAPAPEAAAVDRPARPLEAPAPRAPRAATPSQPPPPPQPVAPVQPASAAGKSAEPATAEEPIRAAPAQAPLGEISTAALQTQWPAMIATATRQSPLLGQALAHAEAIWEAPDVVVLQFGRDNALFQDGANRQLVTIEHIVSASLGRPVRIQVRSAREPAAPPTKQPRLTQDDLRNQRLAQLRSRDPALDAAANSLDLELIDGD